MPEKIGQYTVVSQIGRGGMGIVYKARDESLNRFVAIKVLGEQLTEDKTFTQRFVREAQAAAGLSHPNIVQIYFIGEDNAHPFFVMEYVTGRSLDQLLRAEGKIDNPRASQIILQAAHGLAAAHDMGIIHRDIKPANLILDDRGLLKIADFGLALPVDAHTQLTATGMFVGTPGYLAPEQVSGEKADLRTDIYALGVAFYVLLTATEPFRGDSPLALVRQIMDTEPADVTLLNPKVDAETRRILGKMIAKDRAQRYQSCHELIADLEEYLAKSGVRSMTAGLATRTGSSPAMAAAAATPTQVTNPKPEAQSAPTFIQPKTLGETPLVAPNTQPDAVVPPRAKSRGTLVAVVIVLALLLGVAVAAVMVGTKVVRSFQARSEQKTPDTVASKTTTAPPPPATTTAPEGVLLSQPINLPATITDSKGPQPASPQPADAGMSARNNGAPASAGIVPAKAGAPSAGARDSQTPAPGQSATAEKHPTAAEKTPRARAGVVVAATGDAGLSGAVSSVLRSELEAAGIDVVDGQTLPATEDLLRRGDVSAGRLIDRLRGEGYATLVLARIDPTGQRELSYYGRHDTAYSSRVTLTTYDLATGRPLGSSRSTTVEYTSISAQSESEEAVGPLAKAAASAIRSH